ncbi:YkgJ family cysteine cluster protein [Crocinitomicaceae bacterium]|nr:YkgJ family cysteine cluster protein [Crocinitomicaceae bacterium]
MEYQDELNYSKEELLEVDKMFNRLKRRRPKYLDNVFHEAHDNAFEKIDCLSCGNCCKTKLKTRHLHTKEGLVVYFPRTKLKLLMANKKYLKKDEDGDWVLKGSPCTFLGEDNSCFIYDVRPQACREYPHTNRKKMHQVLDLTRINIEICPAVSNVVRQVTKEYT